MVETMTNLRSHLLVTKVGTIWPNTDLVTCIQKRDELLAETAECITAKATMDSTRCDIIADYAAVCNELQTCESGAIATYNAERDAKATIDTETQNIYHTLLFVRCLCETFNSSKPADEWKGDCIDDLPPIAALPSDVKIAFPADPVLHNYVQCTANHSFVDTSCD